MTAFAAPSPEEREAAIVRLEPYWRRAGTFSGWDFSRFGTRDLGPPLPWDYRALVREAMARSRSALDIGTGGGEFLSSLAEWFPQRMVATEAWDVNYDVAGTRLRPLGVNVVYCDGLRLPFEDGTFDLVIDRHEALDPGEVARVLAPGGRLITQQVGRSNWRELRTFIPRKVDWGDLLREYVAGLSAAGMECRSREHEYRVAFKHLGTLVAMLRICSWEIPDFDPFRSDLDGLLALERAQTTSYGLELTESSFLIEAVKRA